LPKEKIPRPSRKNSRFSGSVRLKRVRLTCCSSISTCAKSVFTVRSAAKPVVTAYFASKPTSAFFLLSNGCAAARSVVSDEIA
jgi:hypothetical protein